MTFPRIIFFGTPEFAACSLRRMLDSGCQVVAVVTAPDKPAGRGLKPRASDVKELAVSAGIPVLQPVNLKNPEFLTELSAFRPDLQVVIAFRMLPQPVWSLPRLGTFNLHASLLPQYRGAAPVNHAIINGEKMTGVTTFMLNEKIDEGKILLSEKLEIGSVETAGELHDRLMRTGADLVIRTLEGIIRGDLKEVSQESVLPDSLPLKPAPKIFREDCRISWDQDVEAIHNLIRGLSPYPGAFTEIRLKDGSFQILKIYRVVPVTELPMHPAGSLISDGKTFIRFAAKNGYIEVRELQLQGRKTMLTGDFLRGAGHWFI